MDDSSEDANTGDSILKRTRLSRSAPNTPGQCKPANTVKLWKRALQKLHSIDLDPWLDFHTHDIPMETATRHRYSAIKKKWVIDEIRIKMESVPFDRGAMRECFRLKKLPQTGAHAGDWHCASNYVVKRYISNVDRQVYFDDVRLQMEAKLWAEAFNRQSPPKKVDIFQLSVIELKDPEGVNSNPARIFHIERFMEGEYRKYNSNSGFVDEQLRNTPQAFSHFTFERSGHRLLVVDIQGVGDLYTDPQIHTSDGVGYSDGNLGPRGMALFFHSHQCNPLCEYLGLTKFDLSPTELALMMHPTRQVDADSSSDAPHSLEEKAPSVEVQNEDHPDDSASVAKHCPHLESSPDAADAIEPNRRPVKPGPRRRSVSFNHFGPTVPRSLEHMQLSTVNVRRRYESCSTSSTWIHLTPTDLLLDKGSPAHSLGSELSSPNPQKLDNANPCPHVPALVDVHEVSTMFNYDLSSKPSPSIDAFNRTSHPRNRVSSGDSGYSCQSHFFSPYGFSDLELGVLKVTEVFCSQTMGDSAVHFVAGSTPSLTDASVLTSACVSNALRGVFDLPCGGSVNSNGRDDYITSHPHFSTNWNHGVHHGPCGRLMNGGLHLRRNRNPSESSDLDVEEDRRMASNLLHQLMHESHKPSCADHPTNLDQEIGQSILGQIHHELARLHEAGRFLPGRKGGWSHAGLGGLLSRNSGVDSNSEQDSTHAEKHHRSPPCSADTSIDWTAVLFHERHAAQLGCLEAMIVMAHYYLGLPTQLLLDCPIQPDQNDLRFGVDYLWRAAEGGDRRCMILLAHYLDVSATLCVPEPKSNKYNCSDNFLLLPALKTLSPDARPSISPDAWSEAVTWYKKAVDTANASSLRDGVSDEGLDAEGRYDAAEDLLPVYKILARMADMYMIGGFGLKQDYNLACDLYNQAGELASAARQGRLAAKYFELGEEVYNQLE